MCILNDLEIAVLDMLLAGDLPALQVLRVQRRHMFATSREFTGVGFFTDFGHPSDTPRLRNSKQVILDDVHADIVGMEHGAGFLLFIEDGLIAFLEGHAWAGEMWLSSFNQFTLRYSDPIRDLSRFRFPRDI